MKNPYKRTITSRAMRWAYELLFPAARNSLNLALLLTAHDRGIRRLEFEGIWRVLVLAPHPDDEAIGCGGAILLHKETGARVTVVYLTDGRWGGANWHSESLPEQEQWRRLSSFLEMRKTEAHRCAELLGLDRQVFFDIEDGRVMPTDAVVGSLHRVLEEEAPEVVYVPFLMESHPDHWQTARILQRCLANRPASPQITIRSYEVWRPLVANRLADIGSVEQRKRAAISAYRSQIAERDYIAYIMGLNQYRAMPIRKEFAEAFFDATPEEFCFLVQSANRSRASEV